MPTDGLTIAQLTTVGGIAIAVALIEEVIWRTTAAPAGTTQRFGPILAVGLGIAVGLVAGLLLSQGRLDLAQDVVNGIIGGATAVGLNDVVKSGAGLTGAASTPPVVPPVAGG